MGSILLSPGSPLTLPTIPPGTGSNVQTQTWHLITSPKEEEEVLCNKGEPQLTTCLPCHPSRPIGVVGNQLGVGQEQTKGRKRLQQEEKGKLVLSREIPEEFLGCEIAKGVSCGWVLFTSTLSPPHNRP